MAVQIQFRHDTAANWTSVNPVLAVGEMGVETDNNTFKIGDGETTWSDLGYLALPGAGYDFTWDSVNNSIPESAPASPTVDSDYGVYGQFGKAFIGGSYVRYYFDFLNYPNAWVEGILQDPANVGTVYESAYIRIKSWGSEFPNFSTSDGTNSRLVLASNAGAGYQYSWNFEAQPYLPDFSSTPYVGESWYIPAPFGAFKNGDYVRLYLDPWNDYQLTAWVEGYLSNMGPTDAVLTFERWSDAAVGYPGAVYAGINTTSPYMTLVGKDGIDGIGYDWKVSSASDSPDFNSTEMFFYSDSGFGAYAVGNYVRYYVNPDENPLGWVEGRISYMSSTDMNLAVKSWSPEAFDMVGQIGGQWTIAPYMTLIGEPGLGYKYEWSELKHSTLPDLPAEILAASEVSLPGKFNAFANGDYVKLILNPGDFPLGWVSGVLSNVPTESEPLNYATLTVDSWSTEANGSYSNALYPPLLSLAGKPGINGIDGTDGTDGTDGADGAGYSYTYPFDLSSSSPGMPGDYLDGTPFYVNSTISIPALGAYAVGNFVRYYPNPDVDPTAWVEGQITNIYSDGIDWITISLNNGTSSAAGIFGVDGSSYTIAPYMILIGEKGQAGDTHILQEVRALYYIFFNAGVYNSGNSNGTTSASDLFTIEKASSTSSISASIPINITTDIGESAY